MCFLFKSKPDTTEYAVYYTSTWDKQCITFIKAIDCTDAADIASTQIKELSYINTIVEV